VSELSLDIEPGRRRNVFVNWRLRWRQKVKLVLKGFEWTMNVELGRWKMSLVVSQQRQLDNMQQKWQGVSLFHLLLYRLPRLQR
jgi:hypothetical protein